MGTPTPLARLIASLMPEALQAEEAAVSQCLREAERLGNVPPGVAMRDVSEHARRALVRVRELSGARGQRTAPATTALTRTLASMRDLATDIALSQERSYRYTLLGIHQGITVFLLLEDAAVAGDDPMLADFCAGWLAERARLTSEVERDLAWFAYHPDVALSRATPPLVKKLGRTLPLLAALRPRAP